MNRRALALLLALLAPAAARAETLYVTDVLVVLLRAAPAPEAATVKSLTSGAALEVLESRGAHARVRDAQGASGWIETRYLTREAPAATRLAQAQAELARANARAAELERRGPEPAAAPPPPAPALPGPADHGLWIGISSAMLVIGFLGGVSWARARHRRRLGGMTLNISDL